MIAKKNLLTIAMWGGVILLSGCSKEITEADDTGRAAFACMPDIVVDEQTRATVQLPIAIPAAADFSLTITGKPDNAEYTFEPKSWDKFSNYKQLDLHAGKYTATFTLGDPDTEGSAEYCFEGSADFIITARRTTDVTVKPKLANSAIKLNSTEWFSNYYTDARFFVTTSAGNRFSFRPTAELANRTGTVYVQAGSKLVLSGTATKKQNGVQVEFPATEIGTTKATTLHAINIDASQAGGGALRITLGSTDEMTEVAPVEIELNPEA